MPGTIGDEWALIYATQGQSLGLYHQGQYTAQSNDVPQESERGGAPSARQPPWLVEEVGTPTELLSAPRRLHQAWEEGQGKGGDIQPMVYEELVRLHRA